MSKTFKLIITGLVAGTFLLEAPPAHAIFGIRAARTVIAARRAKKELSSPEDGTPEAGTSAAATTAKKENQSPEDLERLGQGSENT